MSDFLIPIDRLRQVDSALAGQKAAVLGELKAAGFPITDGICLTTAAFDLALDPYQAAIKAVLDRGDLTSAPAAAEAGRAIQHILSGLRLPSEISAVLPQAMMDLSGGSQFLAVRSSAPLEDLPDASLAGLYDSFFGVIDPEGLEQAIIAVWRSFFNPHALTARATLTGGGLGMHQTGEMAVLLQPVVPAECAGVCFSLDPVDPATGCLVINAAWGLGLGVVDGSLPTDTVWINRRDMRIEKQQIVEKREWLELDSGGQVRRMPVSLAHRRAACLPEAWLECLAQFGLAAENQLGLPQDVEWAIADGHLWILQSRPIASLPAGRVRRAPFPVEWKTLEEGRRLWTLMRLPPFGDGPLRPLEVAYWDLRESTRLETCLSLGADRNADVQRFNGCIYYSPAPLPLSQADRQIRQAAYQDLKDRLAQQRRTAWDHWGPEIEKAVARLGDFDFQSTDAVALAEHLEQAMAVNRRHAMLHPTIWFKPLPAYFQAYQRLTGLSGPEAEAAAYRLLDSEENPFSRLMDGIYALAQAARLVPAVAAVLADPTAEGLAGLYAIPDAGPFCAQLAGFLDQFGERTGDGYGSEASITTPTWREQPEQILRLAARYLDPGVEPPSATRRRIRQGHDEQAASLCAACPDAQVAASFLEQLHYTRRVVAVLEIHNHYIDQTGMGHLRRALLSAAGWLTGQGILKDPEEMIWLNFDEILQSLRAASPAPLSALISHRQAAYYIWSLLEPPAILGLPSPRLPARPDEQDDVTPGSTEMGKRLSGQGASSGRVRGRARLVRTLAELLELAPGDILVAENAGPQWSPYFPILGGLVLDSGSLGQHAAAIAREFGIPAVVAVGTATRRIRNGAWILIDGTTGTIELEQQAS